MVNFEIAGKVALITGGASGLGLQYALNLLEKGAKGVTLADVNVDVGRKSVKGIEEKFGKNRAIFVEVDVTNYAAFEEAFKQTISSFGNVDILINNAGILNDAQWQREVDINVNGLIHGMLLGLENYIPKHKSGSEGVIVNISSVAGISPIIFIPIYVGTKFAVHGMTLTWGLPEHYARTKVRVVGVCPGVTDTPLMVLPGKSLGPQYESLIATVSKLPRQTPAEISPNVMKVIEKAPSGTMWVLEGAEPPYQYEVPDRFNMPKKFL
ncbi:15-hydroxyprostaglandin dehydrogenase [NAD(+)]-like [Anthonomus grandis grandis]|uniref:15-hydroxyprostaglandin dehydrogenase [NAD(+)]-like n=1 Tax=Anthonomus grandis grandis TaxID=2921223 RepID=UPI00216675D6|nr:15-hydroxyprostaglandin dehydrogenase [NAD(+)]-like [Anthonomus grandis grandis]